MNKKELIKTIIATIVAIILALCLLFMSGCKPRDNVVKMDLVNPNRFSGSEVVAIWDHWEDSPEHMWMMLKLKKEQADSLGYDYVRIQLPAFEVKKYQLGDTIK